MSIVVRITSADGELRELTMRPGEAVPVAPADGMGLDDVDWLTLSATRGGDGKACIAFQTDGVVQWPV